MAEDQDNTFLTGVNQDDPDLEATDEDDGHGMTIDAMIAHVESQMREFERDAQYLDAEKARIHWESLKKRRKNNAQREMEAFQQEDVRVFLEMVHQHQQSFDRTWQKKVQEHKMRADDLIDQLKWKHDDQQRQLYEQLRKKRMPKFSVELLSLRKKQVLLARNKQYVKAEKVKRKADILEAFEIDNIRRAAKEENQIRFKALLKKQHWDRQGLADKLRIEKRQLLEAKAQDFERLKKRLKNAEQELKRTHVRQALQTEKKLPVSFSSNDGGASPRRPNTFDTGRGAQRTMGAKVYGSGDGMVNRARPSARTLTARGATPGDEPDALDEFAQRASTSGSQTAR